MRYLSTFIVSIVLMLTACTKPSVKDLEFRAQKLKAQGKYEEATRTLLQIVQERPDHGEAYFGLGQITYLQKKNEQAQEFFKKSVTAYDLRLARETNNDTTRMNRAVSIAATGDFNTAFEILRDLRESKDPKVKQTLALFQFEKPQDLKPFLEKVITNP